MCCYLRKHVFLYIKPLTSICLQTRKTNIFASIFLRFLPFFSFLAQKMFKKWAWVCRDFQMATCQARLQDGIHKPYKIRETIVLLTATFDAVAFITECAAPKRWPKYTAHNY